MFTGVAGGDEMGGDVRMGGRAPWLLGDKRPCLVGLTTLIPYKLAGGVVCVTYLYVHLPICVPNC